MKKPVGVSSIQNSREQQNVSLWCFQNWCGVILKLFLDNKMGGVVHKKKNDRVTTKSNRGDLPNGFLPLWDADCAQCLGCNKHCWHGPKGTGSHWDPVAGRCAQHCLSGIGDGSVSLTLSHPSSLLPAVNFHVLEISSFKVSMERPSGPSGYQPLHCLPIGVKLGWQQVSEKPIREAAYN